MDLRSIANTCTQTINPNTAVTLRKSTGFATGAGARQVPTFSDVSGSANIQALSADDVSQIDGLNIQGTMQSVYLRGDAAGVIRPDQTGGDILIVPTGRYVGTWRVVKVLEQWPDWCKIVIVLNKRDIT
jgi:hypothetical protein